MERYESESLGDIMRRAIEESGNSRRFDEIKAINAWSVVLGRDLASKTLKPQVKNGVMTVKVPSAALRQELNMMRSAIAKALNEQIGKNVITNLKLI